MRRLDHVAGKRATRVWPGCVVGSGVAHLVLLGACLVIQPVSQQAQPILRVRLVDAASATAPSPVAVEPRPVRVAAKIVVPPPPSRRSIPKPLQPVAATPPVPVPAVEPVPEPPPVAAPLHQVPSAMSPPSPPPLQPPPIPAPVAIPAAPLAAVPPGPSGRDGAAERPGSGGFGDDRELQRNGGGSWSPSPSRASESEARGVFFFSEHGDGVGAGNGSGAGPGGGLGRGAGDGRGDGAGAGKSGSGGDGGRLAGRGGIEGSSGGSVAHLVAIRRQIEREHAKAYPEMARRDGLQGTAELRFRIAADGSVEAVEILRSSGHRLLDEVSIQTVRRAGPYPIYRGWLRIPLEYRLDR